jgi:hypothetical protein
MKLPWTYWPIMFVALVIVMALAALVGATIGVNPYVAATIGGVALTLYETYSVARHDTATDEKD